MKLQLFRSLPSNVLDALPLQWRMDLKQTRKTYLSDDNREPNVIATPTAQKRFNEDYPDANTVRTTLESHN